MRNLTKVLAMVLALTMMVSVVGFAANYTDVEKGANYEEAVQVLSGLGLVQGMGDGTFGAELNLTRAQGAAFVIRLMGLEETAVSSTGLDTGFTDVPADHWATGYIYTGVQKGIINGMGDGTFAPDADLTYAQIVTMVVKALGYEPLAAELGEWPGNYISAASQIKLTKGIAGKADATITRATTARILYAALTIPKMEKKGVGVNALWEPRNTLILDDLDFVKMIGSVTAVNLPDNEATFDFDYQGVAKDGEYKEVNTDMDLNDGTFDIGTIGADLNDFRGIDAEMYFAYADREYVLVAIVEDASSIDTITLTTGDFDEYDTSIDEITYFTNAEQTKDDEFKLAANVLTYLNGELVTAAPGVAADTFVSTYFTGATTAYVIEIKDTDGDGLYDYAIITDYETLVVKSIDVSKSGLYTIKGETGIATAEKFDNNKILIDTDDDNDALVKIIKDGEEVSVADIEVGDILNIVADSSEDSSNALEVATIYVTNEVVEGTVKYADTAEKFAVIGDTEYDYTVANSEVAASTEGAFYLNILGQIVYVDTTAVKSAYKYGFATTVDFDLDGEYVYEGGTITLLDTTGEWVTLDLNATKLVVENDATEADADATLNDTYVVYNTTGPVDNAATDFAATASAANDSKSATYYINRVVAYKLNSTGAVKEILVNNTAIGAVVEMDNGSMTYNEYEGDNNMLGSYDITEDVVVYNLVSTALSDGKVKEDEIEVTDLSVFVDDEATTVTLYDIDEDGIPAIVVGSFTAELDFASNWLIVKSAYEVTYEEDTAWQITGYMNGEEVVYYYTDDTEVYTTANDSGEVALTATPVAANTIAKGDILIVKANADNEILKGARVTNVENYVTGTPTGVDFSALAANIFTPAVVSGQDDSQFAAAFVAKVQGTRAYVDFDDDNIDAGAIKEDPTQDAIYSMKDSTVVTVYDLTASAKNTISAGSIEDIEAGTVIFTRVDENNKLVEVVVVITETEY